MTLACELEAFKHMESNLKKPAQTIIKSERVNTPQEAHRQTTDSIQLNEILSQQDSQQKQIHEITTLLQKLVSDNKSMSNSPSSFPMKSIQETKQVECWCSKANIF